MKHWGIAVLAAMLFGCPWTVIADQFGDFEYTSDGESVTITYYTGAGGDVVIPNSIAGLPVASIGTGAFFLDDSLVSVEIPSSVTDIEGSAFHRCVNLLTVVIPVGVVRIGDFAFHECFSLSSLTIPESVTTIRNWAFGYCNSLTSVTIPTGVTTMGVGAFGACSGLLSFQVEPGNAMFSAREGVLFDNTQSTLVQFPSGRAGSYAIPDTVTMVVGTAFFDSPYLTEVTVPASVSSPEHSLFSSCDSLTTISVSPHNPIYSELDGVLFSKDWAVLMQFPAGRTGEYNIPDGVKVIGGKAFGGCLGLTGVTIPDGVASIGSSSFAGCTNLTSVNIPVTVTNIGANAFRSCGRIATMIVPEQVVSIGEWAFSNCKDLAQVTIGNGVTRIGDRAFEYCSSLLRVYLAGSTPEVGTDLFAGSRNVTVYHLPGTTGWGETFAGRSAVLWNPVISEPVSAFETSGFSFRITGTENIPIAVEATEDLLAGAWTILETNALSGGTLEFHDEDAGNDPTRVYRVAAP